MTTEDSTPAMESGRIDLSDEWPPLREEPDEQVALALEQTKNDTLELSDRLGRALLNDSEALSDEDVDDLLMLGNNLRGLAANLAHRVPRGEALSSVSDDKSGDC
jgi:hypothetical protein